MDSYLQSGGGVGDLVAPIVIFGRSSSVLCVCVWGGGVLDKNVWDEIVPLYFLTAKMKLQINK